MNKFFLLSVFLEALAIASADPGKDHKNAEHGKDKEEKKEKTSSEEIKELGDYLVENYNISIINDLVKLFDDAEAKCPDIEKKIDEAVPKVEKCIDEIELGSDTLCGLVRHNALRCSKPVSDIIAHCLPEESKDLPALTDKIVLAIVDQVCNSTLEELLELFNPCGFEDDFEKIPACNDIQKVFQDHKNQLPSKSLICSLTPKVRSCVKVHYENNCKNPVTRAATLNFYDAIENSIKDDCDALNKVKV